MIKSEVAGTSPIIVGISTGIVVLAVAFIIAAVYFRSHIWVIIVAALLSVLVLWCYLRAPIAYELSRNTLTVKLRAGSREFGPVSSCRPVHEKVSFAVRLWGNGGLFAVTGWYRNKIYGKFRAYVTNMNRLVLVETVSGNKIVISPADSETWVYPAGSAGKG